MIEFFQESGQRMSPFAVIASMSTSSDLQAQADKSFARLRSFAVGRLCDAAPDAETARQGEAG